MIDRAHFEEEPVVPPTINRFAVMLIPNEAFLRWVQSCFEDEADLTLEAIRREPTVYLFPDESEDPNPYVFKNYRTMLVQELCGWCTDENSWPDDMSIRTFRSFFEIHATSMVLDLAADSLERDV